MNISRLRVRAATLRSALAVVGLAVLLAGLLPASAQNGGAQPTARSRTARAVQGKAKVLKLRGKASKAGQKKNLTYTIVSFPQHGTLTDIDVDKGKVKYTPDATYTGEATFTGSTHFAVDQIDMLVIETPTGQTLLTMPVD